MVRGWVLCLVAFVAGASGAQAQPVVARRPQPPAALLVSTLPLAQPAQRARLIVLTDIEADPDDTMSMVRLMTYSSEIDIEGLVAVTSMFLPERTAPESIHAVIDAYSRARPHLLEHERGFPTAESLHGLVRSGLPVYGMESVGEGKDSGGSELIVEALLGKDPRPLWVASWGGTSVLAQALWKIEHTFKPEEAARLYAKLRVYTISDQDDAGAWIRKRFPTVFYICTPGSDFGPATWLGMTQAYSGSDAEVIGPAWLARNIQQGHGPLGAAYPDIAYGMEGDTPSYLNLIPNGLSDPEHPDWGGWGGRYELSQWKGIPGEAKIRPGDPFRTPPSEPETRPIWTNAEDSFLSPVDHQVHTGNQVTLWRWRTDFQNDFAARMCWASKRWAECNHPPAARLRMPERLTVREGESFHLDATGSTDPDGDSLSYLWFQYREAGSYRDEVSFRPWAANLRDLPMVAPHVTRPETIHFIVRVTDKGTPPLSRYRRVIVTVLPKN